MGWTTKYIYIYTDFNVNPEKIHDFDHFSSLRLRSFADKSCADPVGSALGPGAERAVFRSAMGGWSLGDVFFFRGNHGKSDFYNMGYQWDISKKNYLSMGYIYKLSINYLQTIYKLSIIPIDTWDISVNYLWNHWKVWEHIRMGIVMWVEWDLVGFVMGIHGT